MPSSVSLSLSLSLSLFLYLSSHTCTCIMCTCINIHFYQLMLEGFGFILMCCIYILYQVAIYRHNYVQLAPLIDTIIILFIKILEGPFSQSRSYFVPRYHQLGLVAPANNNNPIHCHSKLTSLTQTRTFPKHRCSYHY